MSSTQRDVLVVGDINLDVLVRPRGAIERGTDVAADIRLRPGGAGANVALGLAGLGASVTLAGCTGWSDSRPVTDLLSAAGVQLAVRRIPETATGTVVAIIDPDGERSMASDRGANLALSAADLPEDLIAAHRHLHVSGYALFDAATGHAALAAMSRAHAMGRTVSVDPGSVAPLRAFGVADFCAAIAGADLLLPNTDEALALGSSQDVEQAATVLVRRFPVVAITCGAAGALWADRDGILRRESVAGPGPVLDTTGAGDAFTAGLLTAWLDGGAPIDCLDSGQQAAAQSVTQWGAQ